MWLGHWLLDLEHAADGLVGPVADLVVPLTSPKRGMCTPLATGRHDGVAAHH